MIIIMIMLSISNNGQYSGKISWIIKIILTIRISNNNYDIYDIYGIFMICIRVFLEIFIIHFGKKPEQNIFFGENGSGNRYNHLTEFEIINLIYIYMTETKETLKIKLLILGESAVGKSSLLIQYIDQEFSNGHIPTIGVQYKQKTIQLSDDRCLKVQVWDTAGTQRFRTITANYYRNIDGFLLVYDITDSKSFETINYWVQEVNSKADVGNVDLLLVGNKKDLEEKREISVDSGKKIADELGILFFETSAKDYESTNTAFQSLIEKIMKKKKMNGKIDNRIKIDSKQQAKEKKSKSSDCC